VEKYIYKRIKKQRNFDVNKIFTESNIQLTEKAEDIRKKLFINDINSGAITGFASSESNVRHLQEINFEKHFLVESSD